MRLSHEEIREIFPEYLRGDLSEGLRKDIESHLKECEDCRGELSFVAGIIKFDVPDPGDLFWKTLPQRVRGAVREERAKRLSIKSLLFRPLPVTVIITALFLLIFIYAKNKEVSVSDPFFKDPLTASVLDYSDISEKDIPLITEELTVDELYYSENSIEYSYHREFASLSSEEIASLYEVLGKEQKRGG